MLIMLGDSVIAAAILREPVRDVFVLGGLSAERFSRLAESLRGGPDIYRCRSGY
jgi:hypothetical protein